MPDKSEPSLPPGARGRDMELATHVFAEETGVQKFKRRLKEEPLIPLGCAATCYALYRAYRSMKARDSHEMNRMFRARIYAQFFTLVAVVAGGIYYRTERQQRKEFELALEAKKSAEKRDAWLKELEVRDREDKGWRERHATLVANDDAGADAGSMGNDNQHNTDRMDKNRAVIEDEDQRRGFGIGVSSELGIMDAVRELVYSSRSRSRTTTTRRSS